VPPSSQEQCVCVCARLLPLNPPPPVYSPSIRMPAVRSGPQIRREQPEEVAGSASASSESGNLDKGPNY
jgi:hypothetical protein